MAGSSDDIKDRLGCGLLVAVWLAIILPCVATPWVVLHYFGPGFSLLSVIPVHIAWFLVAGPPMAASGSKPSSCGWMLIIVSSWPALILNVVLLFLQLGRAFS